MTKEGYTFTKVIEFITLWAGVVKLGCGHIGDIVKMVNFIRIFVLDIEHINWVVMSNEFHDP